MFDFLVFPLIIKEKSTVTFKRYYKELTIGYISVNLPQKFRSPASVLCE